MIIQRFRWIKSREETQQVLAAMSGPYLLIAKLLYGSDLRLMECVRLRVKDLDFARELTAL